MPMFIAANTVDCMGLRASIISLDADRYAFLPPVQPNGEYLHESRTAAGVRGIVRTWGASQSRPAQGSPPPVSRPEVKFLPAISHQRISWLCHLSSPNGLESRAPKQLS
jgi:hypothetical protein